MCSSIQCDQFGIPAVGRNPLGNGGLLVGNSNLREKIKSQKDDSRTQSNGP